MFKDTKPSFFLVCKFVKLFELIDFLCLFFFGFVLLCLVENGDDGLEETSSVLL